MTVTADFSDAVGIKSFNLSYPQWELNNTIDLIEYYPGQQLKTYRMVYNFLIPDDADETQTHGIKLTATNLGDLSSAKMITVVMNGDILSFFPPVSGG